MNQFAFEPTRQKLPPVAGYTQPPMRPGEPHERPATRGDIDAVIQELEAIRGVLEKIYGTMRGTESP
jgi:hypothetical protein